MLKFNNHFLLVLFALEATLPSSNKDDDPIISNASDETILIDYISTFNMKFLQHRLIKYLMPNESPLSTHSNPKELFPFRNVKQPEPMIY